MREYEKLKFSFIKETHYVRPYKEVEFNLEILP